MSALAFFPWVTVPAPAVVGRFRLVPHRVGASLEAEPRLIDAMLAPYEELGRGPIQSATLVHPAGRALTDDLSAAEEAALFRLGDAVAFSGLARRSFFDSRPTIEREQLTLVVRRFTGSDPRAIQVVVRRRDGRRWVPYGAEAMRWSRPAHTRPARWEVDLAMVSALVDAFAAPDGPSLCEALAAFHEASADGDGGELPVARQVLALRRALERLLEPCGPGELPQRVADALAPHASGARVPRRLATLRRFEAVVEPRAAPSGSIAEAWARDLVRVQRVVCGHRAASYWSPEAHLLLGAHVFPALVLARLAAAGARPVAEADRGALLAVPYLCALRNPFARRRSLAHRDPHLWRRALEVAGRKLAQLQLAEVLERSRARAG